MHFSFLLVSVDRVANIWNSLFANTDF